MPIRVQIERVGYYEQYPDKVIRDLLITRGDRELDDMREYTAKDRVQGTEFRVWHVMGAGIDELVRKTLERI